jgi:sec-independent protein translocase protein TatB
VPLNLSFTHIMVVAVVALVVLGPDKLPEAARTAARWIGEFRQTTTGLQAEMRETFGEFAEPFSDLVSTVTGGVVATTSGQLDEAPIAMPGLPSPDVPSMAPLAPAIPALGESSGLVSPGPALPAMPTLGGPPAPGTFSPFPDEPIPTGNHRPAARD